MPCSISTLAEMGSVDDMAIVEALCYMVAMFVAGWLISFLIAG